MNETYDNIYSYMCKNKRLKSDDLIEGIDFFWEERKGLKFRIFTEEYLKSIRKECCNSGCRNCPWKEKKRQ